MISDSERIEQLEYRIEELEDVLGNSRALSLGYFVLGVSQGVESQILGVLMKRPQIHKEQLFSVIYGGRPEETQPNYKLLDVYISRLRRKLERFNVKINTIYGQGWAITQENKDIVKETLRKIVETGEPLCKPYIKPTRKKQ